MIRHVAYALLLVSSALVTAEEVEPGSLQAKQAQKFVTAVAAEPAPCSPALIASENTFMCATLTRDAPRFRAVIDRQSSTADLKPIGPWASYQGEAGQQRSFLYKDGFVTVTYFPSVNAPEMDLMVVQYVIPHD